MSQINLTITDVTTSGKIVNQIDISLSRSCVTVKHIIEARVIAEVEKYNAKLPEYFQGLIQPAEAESTREGYKMKQRMKVDAEKQVYIALQAFITNGFFVLIDDFQAESLNQELQISPNTHISFVKLTPLVGG